MSDHKHFINHECEFYPCHQMDEGGWESCIFCFCPLYLLECPGDYTTLPPSGMKDCSACTLPHAEGGWDRIMSAIRTQLFQPS